MKIVYYVHDLRFPPREGVRKQAWWLAKAMKSKGHDVAIVSTSRQWGKDRVDGIPITYGGVFSLPRVTADVIHYLSHPSPIMTPLLLRARARKQVMTMFDGYLNGFWKRPWGRAISRLVNRKISVITVQTEYQRGLLCRTPVSAPVMKVPPLSPQVKRTARRSTKPRLLFMSHLHPNKGIDEVIAAYKEIRNKREVELVIADSGVTGHLKKVDLIKREFPEITFKGIVNPADELSKAWVYVYPVRHPQETFSVPLSLIEAIQIGTPWIASRVGGVAEYFDEGSLVEPGNTMQLAEKVMGYMRKKAVGKLNRKINNKKVIAQIEKIYEE